MAEGGSRRSTVRLAAALLASLLVAFAVLTYLSYTAAFSSIDTVTVAAPRAGLVMDNGAKVKFRGIQIGKVTDIDYAADQARLTLAINSDAMHYIPSNATVHIAGNTIFGAKSVEFIPPQSPSPTSLRPDAHVSASMVQLEVNTLFQSLVDLLHKIDPVELNGTLSALAEGLRGHGDDFGALLSGLNTLTQQANPKLGALQEDFRKTGDRHQHLRRRRPGPEHGFSTTCRPSARPSSTSRRISTTRCWRQSACLTTRMRRWQPAEQDLIDAINRLRAPLKVASDYSPEFGCLFAGIGRGIKEFAPLIGVRKAGLFTSSSFVLGAPAYTYPESLPIVNASGGPNCRGLPDIPTKQTGGSFYRAPFLVTDNANIPYEPFTELQFDAPSTLQFLFHGSFAERDDF